MKPLSLSNLASFLKRFDNFRNGELRSIEVLSPTTMKITLAGQDSSREFDWISLAFEFSGVSDARLLQEDKLSLVDMSDGISIIEVDNHFAFAVGECNSISNIQTSTCHIISSNLKYQEGLF